MKNTIQFFGLAFIALAIYAISEFSEQKTLCYEIQDIDGIKRGGENFELDKLLLNKCDGRTWTLINVKGKPSEIFGYHTGEEEEENINTLVWTRVEKGQGFITYNKD